MKHEYERRCFASLPELYRFMSHMMQSQLHKAVQMKEHFSIALSGGRSPKEFFHFAARVIDSSLLSCAAFFQVDERFVPAEHSESNRRMIEEVFINPAKISAWYPVDTDCENPETAAAAYGRLLATSPYLKKNEGGTPQFDLVLLGIGNDGHTASLFPGTGADKISDRFAIHVRGESIIDRISLSMPVLTAAKLLIFLVTGMEKRPILRDLFESDRAMPARSVIERCEHAMVLYDTDAAVEGA